MDRIDQALEAGQAVVLPTETVYGLFAKAFDEAAVEGVYALKGRPKAKAMSLNIASYDDILAYSADQPAYLKTLVEHFMPGPLTIVLKANDKVPYWVNSGKETIGFRFPAHTATLQYIKKHGPLIGPSANLSGHASGKRYDEIMAEFNTDLPGLKDDEAILGQDSTIIDLSTNPVQLLRQGEITKDDILAVIPDLRFKENEDDF